MVMVQRQIAWIELYLAVVKCSEEGHLGSDYSSYPIPDIYKGFYHLEGETWPK